MKFVIKLLKPTFSVCRLAADAPLPSWVNQGGFTAVTRTEEELCIVCEGKFVPQDVLAERGWRAFMVAGPLDFSLVGVLASLSSALAVAGVSIFAISTYNTDYLLVKSENLNQAVAALKAEGHDLVIDA
jgi:hypothetical protein